MVGTRSGTQEKKLLPRMGLELTTFYLEAELLLTALVIIFMVLWLGSDVAREGGGGGGVGEGAQGLEHLLCPGHKAYVNVELLADFYLPWQSVHLHASKKSKFKV